MWLGTRTRIVDVSDWDLESLENVVHVEGTWIQYQADFLSPVIGALSLALAIDHMVNKK